MTTHSVKAAHDALIRDFPEMAHDAASCGMCLSTEKAEEVAVPDERTFTSVEHAAILETEVARQTAELRVTSEDLKTENATLTEKATGLEAEKATLLTRVDVLEAEVAAEKAAKDAAVLEFTEFKAAQELAATIETLKVDRSAAIKEILTDIDEAAYFTEARVARWAQMSEEAFAEVLSELTDTAAGFKPFMKNDTKKDGKPEPDEDDKKTKAAVTETAAFKGGTEPTGEGKPSALGQLLGRNRTVSV